MGVRPVVVSSGTPTDNHDLLGAAPPVWHLCTRGLSCGELCGRHMFQGHHLFKVGARLVRRSVTESGTFCAHAIAAVRQVCDVRGAAA